VIIPDWAGPAVGIGFTALAMVSRIPIINRRLARLLDPVVRWWTRGTLTDQVQERERQILARRIRDFDIMEAFMIELSRWAREEQLHAVAQGFALSAPPTYLEFKTRWLRSHPDYDARDRDD
jgi:hypothetical protein